MKLWYISLALSIASCVILMIIFFLPDTYTIFHWTKTEVQAGVLFPVLLVSWAMALFGFLFNNMFIDKNLVEKESKTMEPLKAYLPTYLGIPAFTSFVWFIIRWYKGKPNM
jgi:hypothetical protein